ncbi:hypothetical protein [Actinomadura parmotrematis]|uniref:Integral membrane protein n=1 Tax=Actinomadura parmotrematis TaxID=2864039 RepID=A0ABS7FSI3_9ACTN|nr:hypothetical protein [Actinomadura parmotrematis]MBW8482925.1 hypothetical protein [Actinomadura parmotrematis]
MAGPRPWTLWLFRIAVTVQALLVFAQAVTAGRFLSGSYGALGAHGNGAVAATVAALAVTAAAVLMWRPGGGPARFIAPGALLAVLSAAEMALGFGRVLTVHVPLGVLLTVGSAGLLVQAWRLGRVPAPAGAAGEAL